ncbi:MAG: hypothetical protein IKK98_00455, partial [Oscillospiraceae bacterium]|nr:hypothetical protein [Oscillospiraceae bacterium]
MFFKKKKKEIVKILQKTGNFQKKGCFFLLRAGHRQKIREDLCRGIATKGVWEYNILCMSMRINADENRLCAGMGETLWNML